VIQLSRCELKQQDFANWMYTPASTIWIKEIFVLTCSLFNMHPCEKLLQKELEGNFYSCNTESWTQSSQLTTGAE
jgi:hypothetical protein